jgi:uncharacterized membrane protein YoaK (UPF0700 family)
MNNKWRKTMTKNKQERAELYLHSMMCVIGGFLGMYAVLNRGDNLGSAQTANLLYLITAFFGHNAFELLLRLCGMLLYFSAIEIYVILLKKTSINLQRYSILIDMIGLIVLCFIPATVDPVLGILPIFFMMATQWSVFHGNAEYASSTIFSTNNFRQTALALGEYFCDKDKKQLAKARYFANSLLWYHMGALISYFACGVWGIYSCLICFIPAVMGMVLTFEKTKYPVVALKKGI